MCFAWVHSRLHSLQSSQLLSFTRCYKEGDWRDVLWNVFQPEVSFRRGFLCDRPEHVAAGRFITTSCLTNKPTAYELELTIYFTLFHRKLILTFDLQYKRPLKCFFNGQLCWSARRLFCLPLCFFYLLTFGTIYLYGGFFPFTLYFCSFKSCMCLC